MTFPPGLALALRTAALRRALLACDKLTQDVRGASAHVECKWVVHPHFVVVAPADVRIEMARSGSPLGIGHLANGTRLPKCWPSGQLRAIAAGIPTGTGGLPITRRNMPPIKERKGGAECPRNHPYPKQQPAAASCWRQVRRQPRSQRQVLRALRARSACAGRAPGPRKTSSTNTHSITPRRSTT